MNHFLVVIKNEGEKFTATSPDLPGIIAFGATLAEAKDNIDLAIDRFVRARQEARLPVPESESFREYFAV